MDDFIMLHNIPMQKIGLTMKRENVAAFPQIVEALELGARHFDIPIGHKELWLNIQKFVARKDLLGPHQNAAMSGKPKSKISEQLFITTTIHLTSVKPPDVASIIRSFHPLHMGRDYVDVIFLENPIGLRGSDITSVYKPNKDGQYPSLSDIFERKADRPTLKITPRLPQNLGAVWKKLIYEVRDGRGAAHHIGIRNFSLGQIKAMLKAVTVRPKVVQVELNAYNMQAELRRICHANDIVVVAIHPFGNPNDVQRPGRPLLTKHPVVTTIASALKLNPRTVLLQYLRQCDVPFVFDLRHYKKVTVFKKLKKFALSAEQMNMLAALDRSGMEEDRTELDEWMEKDPVWPFYIHPRKARKDRAPKAIPAGKLEDDDIILPEGKNEYVSFIRKDPKEPPKKRGRKPRPKPQPRPKAKPKPRPKQSPPFWRLGRETQESYRKFEEAVKDCMWSVMAGELTHALTSALAKMLHKTYTSKFPESFCDNMTEEEERKLHTNFLTLMKNELRNVDEKELEEILKPLVRVQKIDHFMLEVSHQLKVAFGKGYENVMARRNDCI